METRPIIPTKQELIEQKISELECSIYIVHPGEDEKNFEMKAGWYIHWGIIGGMIDEDGNETNHSNRFETKTEAGKELRRTIWDGFLAYAGKTEIVEDTSC